MKPIGAKAAAPTLLLLCGILRAASQADDFDACIAPGADPYVGLRADRDFPVSASDLLSHLDSNDTRALRDHAWRLFEKITADSGRVSGSRRIPVWQTWYSFSEIASGGAREQGPTKEWPNPSFFDRNLCAEIRKARLYCPSTLNSMLKLPEGDTREVPISNPRSAMVKTSWLPLNNGAACIGRWDFEASTTGVNNTFRRSVCVLGNGRTAKDCPTQCPVSPANPAVSAKRFYSIERNAQQQLLVGLHFVTRETPQWVWGTVWWHPEPNRGPFAAGRPAGIRRPWRNYLMNVAYDMDRPRELDGDPAIVYNPYLEGQLAGGTASNCVTCHRRAVWPVPEDLHTLDSQEKQQFRYVSVRGSEAAVRTYVPEFPKLLKLHSIWHLTEAVSGPGCLAGQ